MLSIIIIIIYIILYIFFFFFFNDTATTEIYTLSLHDALPIYEVDAALDEKNAKRFGQILKTFSDKTQFVVITHNRATMEAANVLYGVTMSSDGTSKLVSLKLA